MVSPNGLGAPPQPGLPRTSNVGAFMRGGAPAATRIPPSLQAKLAAVCKFSSPTRIARSSFAIYPPPFALSNAPFRLVARVSVQYDAGHPQLPGCESEPSRNAIKSGSARIAPQSPTQFPILACTRPQRRRLRARARGYRCAAAGSQPQLARHRRRRRRRWRLRGRSWCGCPAAVRGRPHAPPTIRVREPIFELRQDSVRPRVYCFSLPFPSPTLVPSLI